MAKLLPHTRRAFFRASLLAISYCRIFSTNIVISGSNDIMIIAVVWDASKIVVKSCTTYLVRILPRVQRVYLLAGPISCSPNVICADGVMLVACPVMILNGCSRVS